MKQKKLLPIPQKHKGLKEITMKSYMSTNWTTQEKIDKFLESHKLPRLNPEEIENLRRSISSKEIESIIQNGPTKKSSEPSRFIGKSQRAYKEELKTIPKLFQA